MRGLPALPCQAGGREGSAHHRLRLALPYWLRWPASCSGGDGPGVAGQGRGYRPHPSQIQRHVVGAEPPSMEWTEPGWAIRGQQGRAIPSRSHPGPQRRSGGSRNVSGRKRTVTTESKDEPFRHEMRSKAGRPKVTDRPGFKRCFGDILESLSDGSMSKRQAALYLGIGHATLLRLLEEVGRSDLVHRNYGPLSVAPKEKVGS